MTYKMLFSDRRLNTGLIIIVMVGALMFYLQSSGALDLGQVSHLHLILVGVFIGLMVFLVNYFGRVVEGMAVAKTAAPENPWAAANARAVGGLYDLDRAQ